MHCLITVTQSCFSLNPRCKPGTRGDNCDIVSKVCQITTPCTSNGACWDTDGTTKCNCTHSKYLQTPHNTVFGRIAYVLH